MSLREMLPYSKLHCEVSFGKEESSCREILPIHARHCKWFALHRHRVWGLLTDPKALDTWPFLSARRKSLTRKNSTCSTRLYKGRQGALEELRDIFQTNTAASAQPVQLASAAITRGQPEGWLPVWQVPGAITAPPAPRDTFRMSACKASTGMLRDSHLCGLGEGQDMLSGILKFPWHGVLPKGVSSSPPATCTFSCSPWMDPARLCFPKWLWKQSRPSITFVSSTAWLPERSCAISWPNPKNTSMAGHD